MEDGEGGDPTVIFVRIYVCICLFRLYSCVSYLSIHVFIYVEICLLICLFRCVYLHVLRMLPFQRRVGVRHVEDVFMCVFMFTTTIDITHMLCMVWGCNSDHGIGCLPCVGW